MLRKKDKKTFDYLYDSYSGALYGVILKIIKEEQASQDVLQDVFVKIWKNIETFDASKGRLFTWMVNIARNSAIDVLRSGKFQVFRKNLDIDASVYKENEQLSVTDATDTIGLNKLVAGLQDDYRKVIDLAYFKGYTQDEIAKELNIPLGTVKTRCRNALLQLKKVFKR